MNQIDQTLSIIVPCKNEALTLPHFIKKIHDVHQQSGIIFDIIFVEDGSDDGTFHVLEHLKKEHHATRFQITLLKLSRNFGKELAMIAGLDHAIGDALVFIDADMQDPPVLILEFLKEWQENGTDVVYGQRTLRSGDGTLKKVTANIFYHVFNCLSRTKIPVNAGDYRLLSRRAYETLKLCRERHRFFKGLYSWIGYSQTAIPYVREPRYAGRSAWSYINLFNLSLEGITGHSVLPLKISTYLGLLIAIFSGLFAMHILIKTLVHGADIPGYPSLMITILFMGGIQLFCIGILGEYVGRIFNESKNRPLYIIEDTK